MWLPMVSSVPCGQLAFLSTAGFWDEGSGLWRRSFRRAGPDQVEWELFHLL